VCSGFSKGQSGPLDAGRQPGPAHRAVGAVQRDGRRAVPGQIGRHHRGTAGVTVLERVGDALVQRQPRRDREPHGDNLAEQVMRQPGPGAIADQDTRPHALLDKQRHGRSLDPAHLAEHIRQHFITGHRGGLHQRPATRGQPLHPTGHQIVGRSWNRARRLSRISEDLDELAGEEGVAVGAAVHLDRPAIGRHDANRVDDQLEHLLPRQPVQLDQLTVRGQLGQHPGGTSTKFVTPIRTDDHQRNRPVGRGDEPQQLQRRLISPLQVIKHHQRRRVPGQPFQAPGDGIEQPQPRHVRVGRLLHRPGVGGLGSRGGQLGKQPGQLGRVGPGQGLGIGRIQGAQQAAQSRRPRPERRRTFDLGAGTPTNQQPATRGRFTDQRGLPNTGLTTNQHQARTPARRLLHNREQARQRASAPHEGHKPDSAPRSLR
jgi:hypothetical protein